MSVYLATFAAVLLLRPPLFYWVALAAAAVATLVSIAIWEKNRWDIGLSGGAIIAARELGAGALFAVLLIGGADLLVLATTDVRHAAGSGFPWPQLLAVFAPAAIHEEIVFRGYPFQKMWRARRPLAVFVFAFAFAALHAGNDHVTPLALFNIFLGGVVLSLAYGLYERLWFPIGLHLGWNLMSGPVLGYAVSGFGPERTVLTVHGSGPELLSGGAFGLEGSIWMTLVECAAIAVLQGRIRRNS